MNVKLPKRGWRRAALWWSLSALAIFIINLALLLYAMFRAHITLARGFGPLAQGGCSTIRNVDTGIHVVINALSTALLAGSNYCMQCASGPTRGQIDEAHRHKRWLDIGIPSVRNLRGVGWKSFILWLLLAASSLPLHLFYNSMVFSSLSSNIYNVWPLNEGLLNAADPKSTLGAENPSVAYGHGLDATIRNFRAGLFTKLAVRDCVTAYAQPFQSSWGDVILVSNNTNHSQALGQASTAVFDRFDSCNNFQAYQWICEGYHIPGLCAPTCDGDLLSKVLASPDKWQPYGMVVDYCYARKTTETCSLYFSTTLGIVVVALNFGKAVLMCLVTFGRRTPLLTIGDAVSSFLKAPDETTTGMCLAAKKHFNDGSDSLKWSPRAVEFPDKWKGRGRAASACRWTLCILAYIIALGICGYYLLYGLWSLNGHPNMAAAASFGIGAVSAETLISSGLSSTTNDPLLGNVILANAPQLILSVLYFTYNGLFTAMCVAVEWSRFALHRKGLRVSEAPTGSQRSTYFLQLPYRYSVPLMIASGVLHWLVSQSIFLVYVEPGGEPASNSETLKDTYGEIILKLGGFVTCGWSPLGVLCTICLGGFMVLFLVLWSFRRLPSGVPVAASCSAAIAAACHLQPREDRAWERPLMWGVTKPAEFASGHCGFSSGEVMYPVKSGMYQ